MDESLDPRVRRTHAAVLGSAGAILLEDGWTAVTHANVAERAGFSRATVYTHWPEPIDLVRAAFGFIASLPHHEPTGELRADLIGELVAFRDVMVDRGFGRVLAALAERAADDTDIASIRTQVATDGAALTRELLGAHLTDGDQVEAMTSLLLGAVIHRVIVMGEETTDAFIATAVDLALAGAGLPG